MSSKKRNTSTKKRRASLAKLIKSKRYGMSVTDIAIRQFLQSLNTPRSLAVWLLYRSDEHLQLSQLEIQPSNYDDPWKFRDDYTATNFLSKSNFLKMDVDRQARAFEKFEKFELRCGQTNTRFRNLSLDPLFKGANVWLLNATIRKIEEILGDFSPEELVEEANWGPGVTTKLHGCHVSAVNKFHSENGITRSFCDFLQPWFASAYPGWATHQNSEFGDVRWLHEIGNKVTTVPKNSLIDRVIAVEPGMNLFFQKAVGRMIRKRLLRFGINLRSQKRNQQLSKLASIFDHLATADFSSASDSIAARLVEVLLPTKWHLIMDLLRSQYGTDANGEVRRWNKFSSMGNGFTFELESLIFFAAALTCCEYVRADTKKVSVYGDDVIIPVQAYPLFSDFSDFLGFTLNPTKSFSSGYFRESCGDHYYAGIDCKPIFLKERLQNTEEIYKLANKVRNLAHRRNSYFGCDARFLCCWRHLYTSIPKALRLGISRGFGDGGFIMNFDEATPSLARNNHQTQGFEGYLTECFVRTGKTQYFEKEGLLLARLRSLGKDDDNEESELSYEQEQSTLGHGNTYDLRGRTKISVKRILVPQWYDMGGWF